MSHRRKRGYKLASLDAARTIFFIITGLAIRQSLSLFSHDWPPSTIRDAPAWWGNSDRVIVGVGYLVTVLRYSHGVSQLYSYEKDRVETLGIPSSSRILTLSAFLALLGILFYLMADNITDFSSYLFWATLMVAVDLLYIVNSQVVRRPFRKLFPWLALLLVKLFKQKRPQWFGTTPGYAAHAAVQWIASDILLIIFAIYLLIVFQVTQTPHENLFSIALIVAAVVDYALNREFYFGGKSEKRTKKIVFVCSALAGNLPGPTQETFRRNIGRAQWYCKQLMEEGKVIPFAPHSFYTYLLKNDPIDLILRRYCGLSFLAACDRIYVYLPHHKKPIVSLLNFPKFDLPDFGQPLPGGMAQELVEARKLGIEIKYKPEVESIPNSWNPNWHPLDFEPGDQVVSILESSEPLKRVYVCTYLRGLSFQDLSPKDKEETLKENIKAALWYCHCLVRAAKPVAPFAPQAFFPYFWPLQKSNAEFEPFFEASLELLKICDAVYVYTSDGLANPESLSEGMLRIIELAESLGIEIEYKKTIDVPKPWNPALPDFALPIEIGDLSGKRVRAETLSTVPTMGIKAPAENADSTP